MSGFIFRLFVKLFRKRILREAYRGILAREPDAAGWAAHAAGLSRSGHLAPVLGEMAGSEEHWRKIVRDRAPMLAGQLLDALRDGSPDADELAGCASLIRANSEVGAAAAALVQGPDCWPHLARSNPSALVEAAFKALLGREPDAAGATTYTGMLAATGDITAFLAALADSEEHRGKLLDPAGSAQDRAPGAPVFTAEHVVAAAYRGLLGREPDEEGLMAYTSVLAHGGDITGFLVEVAQSSEHRKRVLLKQG